MSWVSSVLELRSGYGTRFCHWPCAANYFKFFFSLGFRWGNV